MSYSNISTCKKEIRGRVMLLRKLKTFIMVEKLWKTIKHQQKNNKDDYDVIVDFRGINNGKNTAQILWQLKGAGFKPCIRLSHYEFLKNKVYETYYGNFYGKRALNSFPIVSRVRCTRGGGLFVISTCDKKYKNLKIIAINNDMDEFKYKVNEKFYYPIHMHPHKLYDYQWFNDKNNSRYDKYMNERKIGMIFIGNNNADYLEYENCLSEHYHCFSRPQVINFLCSEFAEYVIRPERKEELDDILDRENLNKKILILDKFRVDGDKFIDLFLHSDFHIWMAGVTYPYCHNHIESLYCGTIPVYQDSFYYYGIKNKKNALRYSTLNELKNIISDVIAGKLTQENIKDMRNNVYKLYNAYYSADAYREKIFEFLNSDKKQETYYISRD